MIQELQKNTKELKKAGQVLGNFKQRHGGNGERKKCVHRNTSKYCWSHGECAHEGVDFNWKKPGHQDDANVGDKKGISTERCN